MDRGMLLELKAFLQDLAEEEGLRTTVFESVKGGIMTGAGAMVGGILLGPVGLFAGGALFGGLASATCNNFQPLHQVLAEMPEHRWHLLGGRVKAIMKDRGVLNVAGLAVLAVAGTPVRNQVITELLTFAQHELGRNVIRR